MCRTWQALQGNARSLSHSCHDGGNHHTAAHQTPTNCLHEDVLNLVSHLSLPKKFAATQPLATVADVADHAVFAEESGWLAKENAGERMAPPPADASEERAAAECTEHEWDHEERIYWRQPSCICCTSLSPVGSLPGNTGAGFFNALFEGGSGTWGGSNRVMHTTRRKGGRSLIVRRWLSLSYVALHSEMQVLQ